MTERPSRPDFTWGAMLVFGAWRCADLLRTWRNDPVQTGSLVAFLLWIGHLLVREGRGFRRPLAGWASGGLLFILWGGVAQLNVAEHVGMILVLLSAVESRMGRLLHLALSLTWLPAMAWVLGGVNPSALTALRLLPWGAGLLLLAGRRSPFRTKDVQNPPMGVSWRGSEP